MATWAVTTANSKLEYDTQNGRYPSSCLIDSTNMVTFWAGGASSYGTSQVFTINTSTWAVTTAGNTFLFNGNVSCIENEVVAIDSNHVLNSFMGADGDGFIQVCTINTSTWAITTSSTVLEFDTNDSSAHSLIKIDANHFVLFRQGASADGFANVFTVNTTTWAVTTASSPLEFDTRNSQGNGACMIDTNHAFNIWGGGASSYGFAQCFTINTTTWAVTTAGASLNFNTAGIARYNGSILVDATHLLGISQIQTVNSMYAQIFAVNTTTWAVTTAAARLEIQGGITAGKFDIGKIDTNHFVVNFCGETGDGFSQVLTINTSTWEVTTSSAILEFDTQDGSSNSTVMIDSNHFVNFWEGVSLDGFVQSFAIELPATSNIKTYNTNTKANIKTINTNVIANVKTLDTNA